MTYVSKKEKIFALPEQDEASSMSLKESETRLKRFPSVSDRRAWTSEECQRYQHFYGLVNGSESNVSKSTSFKYIPFDILLAVLMAEKDAYIQELLDRQDDSKFCCERKLYQAESFEDSDDDREALIRKDAEMVALKNKIAGLESELEDYRETLTKAMHKLENMDQILCENNLLQEKIKCSEETIKYLEEKKTELEKELEYMKKCEDIPMETRRQWDRGDYEEITRLSSERDILIHQMEELQDELNKANITASEVEDLRKLTEKTSSSLEELSKENEGFKKKLDGMKCLEKHIEELKKQAHTLTEKYKRESQKANDLLNQLNFTTKELQFEREEKSRFENRVKDLLMYENQFFLLQAKLQKVEAIIDENEFLNKELMHFERLKKENEHLKVRIDQLKYAELQAAEDKEKIRELHCVLADQKEEIRKLLQQIDDLSQGYAERNEIHRINKELEEKNMKLKKCEKQLAEIPVLESEIDELRNKLQKCIDDFRVDKDLLIRLQEELEACRRRCHELEEMAPHISQTSFSCTPDCKTSIRLDSSSEGVHKNYEIKTCDKEENTFEIWKQDMETQCVGPEAKEKEMQTMPVYPSISNVCDFVEENKNLKIEVKKLKAKLSEINVSELVLSANELQNVLLSKETKILELQSEISNLKKELQKHENTKKLQTNLTELEENMKILKEKNNELENKLEARQNLMKDFKKLEECLKREKKALKFASILVEEMEEKLEEEKSKRNLEETIRKLTKEETNIVKQELYSNFSREVRNLKDNINLWKKLTTELKRENRILREMKKFTENTEQRILKELIKRLHAEVKVLKSLSKTEIQKEFEGLQDTLQSLVIETDNLMKEIVNLKAALETEKISKEFLEKEVTNLQAELSACLTAGNEVLGREIAVKDSLIANFQNELADTKNELDVFKKETSSLKQENLNLYNDYNNLKFKQEDLENEIKNLKAKTNELNDTIKIKEEKLKEKTREIEVCQQMLNSQKNDHDKMKKELAERLESKVSELEELLTKKQEEANRYNKMYLDVKAEMNKVTSEMEVLRSRLAEKESMDVTEINYEKDLEEKYALEEALRKVENELDELKVKLEECQKMEDDMTILRNKKGSLIEKMTAFDKDIDSLKKKLCDFDNVKMELEQLKAEKYVKLPEDTFPMQISELQQKLKEQISEAEHLKSENENLKAELTKTENILEVFKKLQRTVPQNNLVSSIGEFFTPPALPSPHSSVHQDFDTDMLPLEVHKKELTELENHYTQNIQQLKEENAEKTKKLIEQHEKEIQSKSKSFFENINTIRSGYENDIRKLVEKHKLSIMRLQSLHEDEIQELNTNYETQMEAMQTQNENVVNDLRTESAEKLKELAELHSNEVKELTEKFEKLLKEKESQIMAERSTDTQSDTKESNQPTVEELTQFYQTTILNLEEKHNKELKKCKKNNLKRIEGMKNTYENLLEVERKKYEEQMEEVLLKLKKGQPQRHFQSETASVQKKSFPTPCLEFLEVLQKIINEGLESLNLEELILVHSKTCFLPLIPGEEGTEAEEEVTAFGDGCKHKLLMGAEKEELLKRIFSLEREMIVKQLETHDAIVNMENAEKHRIQELKNALCAAQQKNAELKRMITNQSKLQMDLKIERYMSDRQASLHETNAVEKVKELERERAEKRRLEEELQKERTNVKFLTAAIEAEKERFKNQKKKDSEYIDSIRLRLEEALNHEQMMESQLDYEAKFRAKLESELQALQKSINLVTDPESQQPKLKAVKDIQNFMRNDKSAK